MSENFCNYIVKQGDTLSGIVAKFKNNTLFADRRFQVEDGLSWQAVWDLEENKAAGCICSPANMQRKNKHLHWVYPGEIVKLPYVYEMVNIPMTPNEVFHIAIDSDKIYFVKLPGQRIIVDAHMHIQSLHATPMPIQWGTAFKGLKEKLPLFASSHIYNTRKQERDTTVAWYTRWLAIKDFGCIGQFSTDMIAKVFLGQARNDDMKKKLYWLLGENPQTSSRTETQAGAKLGLGELAEIRDKEQHDFIRSAAYYFNGTDTIKLNIIMPMDLSFAHFWGNYGIPINLPGSDGQTFNFINDFLHIKNTLKFTRKLKIEYEPRTGSDKHLYFDIRLQEKLRAYLAYYRGLYELGAQDPPFELRTDLDFSFDHTRVLEVVDPYKGSILNRRGIPDHPSKGLLQSEEDFKKEERRFQRSFKRLQDELRPVLDGIEEQYGELLDKQFKHFVEEIPGDNTEMFEDYFEQTLYTEAAVFRAPLEMLAFYHYDPRRYYFDDGEKQKIMDNLQAEHSFFTLPKKEASNIGWYPREMLDMKEVEWSVQEYFSGVMDGTYWTNPRTGKRENKTKPNLVSFDNVKRKFFPEGGAFLGIKLYAPLGYPANIYKKNDLERYKHLEKLFEYCETNQLPITVHGSPNGMTIPDGLNYLRYDMKYYKQRLAENDIDIDRFLDGKAKDEIADRKYGILRAVDYLDYICNRPALWEQVLADFPDLKLCLAHFGSMGTWLEEDLKAGTEEITFDWRAKIVELIKAKNNLYTDISCYVMEESLPILSKSEISSITDAGRRKVVNDAYRPVDYSHPHSFYRPRPGLPLREEMQVMYILHDYDLNNPGKKVDTIAERLAKVLNQDSGNKLKERIMMGSDWYMSEMGIKGTGKYYHNMFKLLREVTRKLNTPYDAWQQFAVINPLNFLGFLKADQSGKLETETFNGKTVYLLNEEKIEQYIKNLKELPEQEENKWAGKAEIKEFEIDRLDPSAAKNFFALKRTIIYASEEIKGPDDTFTILSAE